MRGLFYFTKFIYPTNHKSVDTMLTLCYYIDRRNKQTRRRVIEMDMNPKVTAAEKNVMAQVMPLQFKHIITKNYGDGEIERITRKNDLSGVNVYFHSNRDGVIKLDGAEFIAEVTEAN